MFRPSICFLGFIWTFGAVAELHAGPGSEAGRFVISSYSSRAYNASPQDWAITQDSRGLMYFGNEDGVLQYDGSSWRKIPIPNGVARVLTTSISDRVYVGGDGVIGYLRPDQRGVAQFVSLLDAIPAADRQFGIVQSALASPDGVYFSSQSRLFLFRNDGRVDIWSVPGGFRRMLFRASGKVYVSGFKAGPLTLENGQLHPCHWAENLGRPLVAGTRWNGLVILASPERLYELENDQLKPFSTEIDDYLSEHKIYLLDSLPDGSLVIGTRSGGLVLLRNESRSGRFVAHTSGLPGNSVTGFYLGLQGNIWVATNGGLAHFLPSLTYFSETHGLGGNVYSVARQDGVLYVGSTGGLYRLRPASSSEPVFERVEGIGGAYPVWTILNTGNGSLAGADGIYSISDRNVSKLWLSEHIYDLHPSRHDRNLVYAAGREGVLALRNENSGWRLLARGKGNGQDFRTVAEDVDGRVWATTRLDIWRFDLQSDPVKAERFDKANGVPEGWKNVYQFRNEILFATGKGLLQFSESDKRFVPNPVLGTQFSDGTRPVSMIKEDGRHNVWVTGKGYHGFLRDYSPGKLDWVEMPLLASGIEEIWALHIDPDGTVWAAGEEGSLFRWTPEAFARPEEENFQVLIRQLSVAESKTALFGGSGPLRSDLHIPYRENALRFEVAAPFYEAPSAVQYQFRLDKNDRHWSPWTTEAHKDFTNLPPRDFVFRVRARSPHGAISPEATFAFQVLPPWYRTWWAYSFYLVASGFLAWLIFRWRLRVLRTHNQHLERVVQERTAEVRTQRDRNEALLLNILPARIASELRDTGSVTPTIFEDVTVCFTDFVGFTVSSEKLSADHLVTALNEYFTVFDAIMARYKLEKLKTIGDSYMFVSGLPEQRSSHAVDAVLAALEMLHVARSLARPDRETDWRMRVGLYSGPVVAGVVGKSKFAFDIWGNTVNLASRMESSGAPDRVNLSNTTCNHVHRFIDCQPRGRVRIKEGRELEMHFALGVKPELLQGPLVDGVPSTFRDLYRQTFSRSPLAFPAFLLQTETALTGD